MYEKIKKKNERKKKICVCRTYSSRVLNVDEINHELIYCIFTFFLHFFFIFVYIQIKKFFFIRAASFTLIFFFKLHYMHML